MHTDLSHSSLLLIIKDGKHDMTKHVYTNIIHGVLRQSNITALQRGVYVSCTIDDRTSSTLLVLKLMQWRNGHLPMKLPVVEWNLSTGSAHDFRVMLQTYLKEHVII